MSDDSEDIEAEEDIIQSSAEFTGEVISPDPSAIVGPSATVIDMPAIRDTSAVTEYAALDSSYGRYIKRSRACPICLRHDHMEINRMRACEHKTLGQIGGEKTLSPKVLDAHFLHHFIISKNNQDIINLKEDTNQEANEIITRILDGDIDLYGGAVSVLESKAQRLKPIKTQISMLQDKQELASEDGLEVDEIQELIMLNKLAEEIENSIIKVYQIIDKKVFPTNKEDIAKAVLSYKHSVLRKFVDNIIIVLMEFEKQPEYRDLIQQLRQALSQRVSYLEASILKSGGVMKAIGDSPGDL